MADFTPHEAPAHDALSLPVQPPAKLVGRDVTIGRIYQQLKDLKPVVLYGAPGIGKSALAATLASAYAEVPGGVLYLPTKGDTLNDLIVRIGRAYKMPAVVGADNPADQGYAVAEKLGQEKPLVVLDGMLTPQVATDFVQRLARNVPVLIVNEHEMSGPWQAIRLGKLEPAQSAALVRLAGDIKDDAQDEDIRALCESLAHTPLALHFAAAWVKATKQPVSEFIKLLPNVPSPDIPTSLLALTASFRSLSGPSSALQALLLMLGAGFTSGASAELMSMVANAPLESVANAFNLLAARGLVERTFRGGEAYYRLHEVTVTFVQTWLKGSKGLDVYQPKFRDAVRAFTRKYAEAVRTAPGQAGNQQKLAVEMDNILACARWAADNGDRDTANQIAAALASAGGFVSEHGYAYDVRLLRGFTTTSSSAFPAHEMPPPPASVPVASDEDEDEDDEDELLDEEASEDEDEEDADEQDDVLPLDEMDLDDEDEDDIDDEEDDDDVVLDELDADDDPSAPPMPASLPVEPARSAVIQARQLGDRRQQGEQLSTVAQTLAAEGKLNEALATYTEALTAYDAVNDTPGILSTLHALAELEIKTDNLQAAVLHASRGITLAHDYDNTPARIRSLSLLGDARQELGESEDAIRAYESALELTRAQSDDAGEANLLLKLGYAQLDTGDSAHAIRTWDDALDKARALGLRSLEARALGGIGTAKGEMGHWTEAISYYSSSLHIAREAGDRDEEAIELGNLAHAHVQENQLGKAVLRYRQALHLAYESSNKAAIIGTTVDLARLFVEVPTYMKLAELIVDYAITLDAHDVDLRRLKERIEDEMDALGDSVSYKPVGGTAQQYAANAYALDG